MKLTDYLRLMRVPQWYKNLVVYLALFFSGHLLIKSDFLLATGAFLALSLVSSAGYILNDLLDLKKDQRHPEKKIRPLTSGKILPVSAVILLILLLVGGLSFGLFLGKIFFYFLLALFLLTLLYSLFLKKIIFADILTIAALFVLRAVSGAYLIKVWVSPWLILCPFFLSLFLSVGKRQGDLLFLQEKAAATRQVLQEYDLKNTSSLLTITTTLLIISYALYSFLSENQALLLTLPLALYVIFQFSYLINRGSEISRHPERIIKDKKILLGILLWLIITFIIVYL